LTCRALTSQTATYSQTNDQITVNIAATHTYNVGNGVYIDFTSGAPSSPPDGFYTIVTDDPNDIFFVVRPQSAIGGTYSQDRHDHYCQRRWSHPCGLEVRFTSTSRAAPDSPLDGLFTIATATVGVSFTVTTWIPFRAAATSSPRRVPMSLIELVTPRQRRPHTPSPVRATINVTYSDWRMDETDNSALAQTPMRSPTVFNFFLPDYQFPGRLSQAGLITPEFQITSETTVIDQTNFLYNGIYNDFNSSRACAVSRAAIERSSSISVPGWEPAPAACLGRTITTLYALIDRLCVQLMGATLPTTAGGVRER
jgi:hypothetical protein